VPPTPPLERKWRSRALNSETPDGLAVTLMTLGPQLDAALSTPDPAQRETFLRYILSDLEAVTQHVRVAARKAQAAQVAS
jgi:hypothetical protein